MIRHLLIVAVAATTLVVAMPTARAVKLFDQNDNVLAIDSGAASFSPLAESSGNVVDQTISPGPTDSTKYLNFGKEQTGFIVTPAFGASTVQSLQLRAANDAPARDPLTYELYGTNDAISSGNNSLGDQESWSLISSGATGLDTDPGRHALGAIEDIVNAASYASYKMIFPTLRDTADSNANSMQIADVQLFTDLAGAGSTVLASGDPTLAVTHDAVKSLSSYPDGENPTLALDGDVNNKYLNRGGEDSGLILSRADNKPTVIESLTFTTGGDAPGRDPLSWDLYGTNDPITSLDNSRGLDENWTLVDSGVSGLEEDPGRNMTVGAQPVDGIEAYGAYRLVFTSLRGSPGERLMQVGDILIEGRIVPEPSSFVLLGVGALAALTFSRRR